MVVETFMIRRLARLVQAGDVRGTAALVELMLSDAYQLHSADEMVDLLRELDAKVQRFLPPVGS